MTARLASATYRHQIVEMGPAELPQLGSSVPRPRHPWDQLPNTPQLSAAKGLPEMLSSGSWVLLRKWHHLPSILNTSSDAEALEWCPRQNSAVHLCQPTPPTLL